MIFRECDLPGVWIIEPQPIRDSRGSFARTYCAEQFAAHGLNTDWVQNSISVNRRKRTLRGLHFQCAPSAEIKLIRCTSGAAFDVAVDIRPDSPTYRRWAGIELAAESGRMVYLPEGIAHGFQTLADGTEIFYQMSASYDPKCVRGYRFDDPAFDIDWPLETPIMSDRDLALPCLEAVSC